MRGNLTVGLHDRHNFRHFLVAKHYTVSELYNPTSYGLLSSDPGTLGSEDVLYKKMNTLRDYPDQKSPYEVAFLEGRPVCLCRKEWKLLPRP